MLKRLGSYVSYENEPFFYCGSCIPILRGHGLEGRVMLSQALIAMLLMAGISGIYMLMVKYQR